MKSFFVGIDISKATLDIAILESCSNRILSSKVINNDIKSIHKWIRQLNDLNGEVWVCFEHTGSYGLLLSSLLQSNHITYSAVSALEIKRSMGITRGKSDKIDAQRISKYAARHYRKLVPTILPSDILLKIKHLLTYRRNLVKIKRSIKTQIKEYKVSQQVLDVSWILTDLHTSLDELKGKIKRIEKAVKELLEKDPDIAQNYERITSVKGVGMMIAAHMILYTNNFTSFTNARKFNSYCGVAPFENSSGIKSLKPRTSKLRNRIIKSLLFNGANSAVINDQQLKKYYQRKKSENKAHNTIINAVACKLIARMFAVVRRNENYVELAF